MLRFYQEQPERVCQRAQPFVKPTVAANEENRLASSKSRVELLPPGVRKLTVIYSLFGEWCVHQWLELKSYALAATKPDEVRAGFKPSRTFVFHLLARRFLRERICLSRFLTTLTSAAARV